MFQNNFSLCNFILQAQTLGYTSLLCAMRSIWTGIFWVYFNLVCFFHIQMFGSIIFAAVGVLGAGYAVIVSGVAINHGPKCFTNEFNNATYPFENGYAFIIISHQVIKSMGTMELLHLNVCFLYLLGTTCRIIRCGMNVWDHQALSHGTWLSSVSWWWRVWLRLDFVSFRWSMVWSVPSVETAAAAVGYVSISPHLFSNIQLVNWSLDTSTHSLLLIIKHFKILVSMKMIISYLVFFKVAPIIRCFRLKQSSRWIR